MLTYLHGDHLGSASLATDANGAKIAGSDTRYFPYGALRPGLASATLPTDRRYTGQRFEAGLGLYDYHARFYDPYLGRFISADTIVPSPGDPQSLNRYAYVRNNPLKYTDPSGHALWVGDSGDDWDVPPLPAGRYLYSEEYGWFDRSHLNTGDPAKVIADVRQAIANRGEEFDISQNVGGTIAVLGKVQIWYIGTYQVSGRASAQDATGIALGIYMDWSHKFETWEGSFAFGFGDDTSYAIEDLPTHWIGFFAAAKGISPAEVFMKLGGVEGTDEEPPRDIKNHTFNSWVDDESVPWPSSLTITPVGSGPNTWEFIGANCEGFACNDLTKPNP